ncbi:MAG: Holliday junction branch migration protein RuvA [Planctomycetaceae bacterium]
MITRITGKLVRLRDTDVGIAAGPFEYQVLVPEIVRRQLQSQIDREVSLHTIEYIDGNITKGGRMTPRLVGFLNEVEREFFEMVCQVDGLGVKKVLGAMVRPVQDIASAIEDQDVKLLSTLPGIGAAVAERIIAKLRRKMARFALLVRQQVPVGDAASRGVLEEGYEALLALGHTSPDAREKIEQATASHGKFKSVEDLLQEVYRQGRGG